MGDANDLAYVGAQVHLDVAALPEAPINASSVIEVVAGRESASAKASISALSVSSPEANAASTETLDESRSKRETRASGPDVWHERKRLLRRDDLCVRDQLIGGVSGDAQALVGVGRVLTAVSSGVIVKRSP
jgi:hypothetical protein